MYLIVIRRVKIVTKKEYNIHQIYFTFYRLASILKQISEQHANEHKLVVLYLNFPWGKVIYPDFILN